MAAVTEQTTEAFDWKLIGFIALISFSHSISMVWIEYIDLSTTYPMTYGSGHEIVAVLLPGFAINW